MSVRLKDYSERTLVLKILISDTEASPYSLTSCIIAG